MTFQLKAVILINIELFMKLNTINIYYGLLHQVICKWGCSLNFMRNNNRSYILFVLQNLFLFFFNENSVLLIQVPLNLFLLNIDYYIAFSELEY